MSSGRRGGALFIVEGGSVEPRLVSAAFDALGIAGDYEVVPFGTTVHQLLEVLETEYGGDYAAVSLPLVLREMHPQHGDVLSREYDDVFLVFDHDPHDDRFDPGRLERLAEAYSNSGELGLLLLNYPMAESYRHFYEKREEAYLERRVGVSGLGSYKGLTGGRDEEGRLCALSSPEDLARGGNFMFAEVVALNAAKVEHLVGGVPYEGTCLFAPDLARRVAGLDLAAFLRMQNGLAASEGEVYVCHTSAFVAAEWPRLLNGLWKRAREAG